MTDEIKKQIIIYLIEDDTSQRESIESLLAFKGYLVKSFRNANDFLKLNNIHRPSVLITDIHLPGQSGVLHAFRYIFLIITCIFQYAIADNASFYVIIACVNKHVSVFC